jgi:phage terminase large subunit
MELQRLGYPNQYVRTVQDSYTGKTEKRFGFRTTSLTRPTAISRLVEIVRDHCDTIRDRATLEELLTIIKNEKGRIEAPQGGHDDEMMGLAIAHQVREQVIFPKDPIQVVSKNHFSIEPTQSSRDWGERITII